MTLIQDNMMMVIVAMIVRALQGFTRTISAIPCRSLIVILEPEQIVKYMGYLEAALTLGDGIGPIIGSFLYKTFGFVYLFMILGFFHFIYIPLMALVMPKDIDSENEEIKSLVKNSDISSIESEISMCKLLSNKLVIL